MQHVTILRTELVGIDSISTHPENARRGNVSRIENSLREHGQYAPVIVHESTGYILKGNHTHRVMKEKLGKPHILATFVRCTDEQARAVLAVDNKTTDGGEYDDLALLELLEKLDDTDMLAAAGYEQAEYGALLEQIEALGAAVPEPDPFDVPDTAPDTAAGQGLLPDKPPVLRECGHRSPCDCPPGPPVVPPETRHPEHDRIHAEGEANAKRLLVLTFAPDVHAFVREQIAHLKAELDVASDEELLLELLYDGTGVKAPIPAR